LNGCDDYHIAVAEPHACMASVLELIRDAN
jgi:hypothetical protein